MRELLEQMRQQVAEYLREDRGVDAQEVTEIDESTYYIPDATYSERAPGDMEEGIEVVVSYTDSRGRSHEHLNYTGGGLSGFLEDVAQWQERR